MKLHPYWKSRLLSFTVVFASVLAFYLMASRAHAQPAAGDFLFQAYPAVPGGLVQKWVTPVNNKAFGINGSGQPAMLDLGGAPTWDSITGKPATFPPSAHNQAISTITGLQTALDDIVGNTQALLDDKAPLINPALVNPSAANSLTINNSSVDGFTDSLAILASPDTPTSTNAVSVVWNGTQNAYITHAGNMRLEGNLDVAGGISSTGFSGVGTALSALDASNISTGSLALARIAQGGATSGQAMVWNGSTWAPATVGVSDGNKGSITVGSSGTVWTINAGAVTDAMLAGSITPSKVTGTAAVLTGNSFTGANTTTLGTNSVTPATALTLANSAAATVGLQSATPALILSSYGWKTTATAGSQRFDWRIHGLPVQGTTVPDGSLLFQTAQNGGAYSDAMVVTTEGAVKYRGLGFPGAFILTPSTTVQTTNLYYALNGVFLAWSSATKQSMTNTGDYLTDTGGQFGWSDVKLGRQAAGVAQINNGTLGTLRDLSLRGVTLGTAGLLTITSGSNQRAGDATLVAGTVTVNNTTVTANTRVFISRKTAGGTLGMALTYAVTASTSFTITSDNVLDTSVVSYFLVEVP